MTGGPPSAPRSSDAASWAAIGGLLALVLAIQLGAPLPVDPSGFAALGLACAALAGAALFYGRVRPNERFAATCIALIQVLLFSTFGCILSYMLARSGGLLWDGQFVAWDRSLGFVWVAYVRLIDSQPWLAVPLHFAYGSLIPQVVVLLLAVGFAGRLRELRTLVLAAILCGTATVLLSPLFPAVSAYVYHGLTSADFRHVDPWAGYAHLQHYTALRSGTVEAIHLPEMEGLITFPSYHAGLSAVTFWGFCMARPGWLKWAGMTVAAATILATPVDGGHYLVDVLAGIALAVASIVAAKRAVGWSPPALALKASPSRRSRGWSAR